LERELGVTYKTAWRIFNKIRSELMMPQDNEPRLGAKAPVEIDETYVGGKPRYRSKNSKVGRGTAKSCVIGAVERGGRVFARKIDSIQIPTMMGFIKKKFLISPKSSPMDWRPTTMFPITDTSIAASGIRSAYMSAGMCTRTRSKDSGLW